MAPRRCLGCGVIISRGSRCRGCVIQHDGRGRQRSGRGPAGRRWLARRDAWTAAPPTAFRSTMSSRHGSVAQLANQGGEGRVQAAPTLLTVIRRRGRPPRATAAGRVFLMMPSAGDLVRRLGCARLGEVRNPLPMAARPGDPVVERPRPLPSRGTVGGRHRRG
jgi:hypothetical protein